MGFRFTHAVLSMATGLRAQRCGALGYILWPRSNPHLAGTVVYDLFADFGYTLGLLPLSYDMGGFRFLDAGCPMALGLRAQCRYATCCVRRVHAEA